MKTAAFGAKMAGLVLVALEHGCRKQRPEGLLLILGIVRSRQPDGSYCERYWNEDGKPTGTFVEEPVKAYVQTAEGIEVVSREKGESEEAFLGRLPDQVAACGFQKLAKSTPRADQDNLELISSYCCEEGGLISIAMR